MMEGQKGYRFLMEAPGVSQWVSFLQTRGLVRDERIG